MNPQFFRLGFNHARNRTLLDNGITARTQPVPKNKSVISLRRHATVQQIQGLPSRLTCRLMAMVSYCAYSPPSLPSELLNTNSTEAVLTGLRPDEPLNITSAILPPRKCLAELSPITQRTASIILDLPQPLGPTIAVKLPVIGIP